MKLRSIDLYGFRSLQNPRKFPVQDKCVLIGENDAGKSSILDALEIFFENKKCDIVDFFTIAEPAENCEEIKINLEFELSDAESISFADYSIENILYTSKVITTEGISNYYIKKYEYIDNDFKSIESCTVDDLRSRCASKSLPKTGNKSDLIDRLIECRNQNDAGKEEQNVIISYNELFRILPQCQRFSSADYGNPLNYVEKVLKRVYRSHFYEINSTTGKEELKPNAIKAIDGVEDTLHQLVKSNLLDTIKKYNSDVIGISPEFTIDLGVGLKFTDLSIDTGTGLRPVTHRGEGAKNDYS